MQQQVKGWRESTAYKPEDVISLPNPLYQRGHPAELRTVTVARALRDDPLGRLHARRQIGLAQYRAGRAWQAAYEAAAIGHVGSIDPSNEPVDGSPKHAGPNIDRITKAAKKLAQWLRLLGIEGSAIVVMVLARRMTMAQVAQQMKFGDEEYYGKRFRECLNTLARDMGYMGKAA